MVFSTFDHVAMTRALRLAERGAYTTKPNPMVGCVITRDDVIIGEGYHVRAGEPHAEVLAIASAGENVRGATAYVTLEPCAHFGRTPPCADALIAAGLARVVIASLDPFPQVNGQGARRLRDAGIQVDVGLLEAEARELNRGFYSRLSRGRPWVTLKLASSMDGHTALASGESKWISSDASRRDVHHYRARVGAIVTGAGTVLQDDPQLTARLQGNVDVVQPLRVVLDPGLATVGRGKIREGDAPTLYVHAPNAKVPRDLKAELVSAPVNGNHFNLLSVLHMLAARQVNEVLVETGATLAGAFLNAKLVDELVLYQSPVLLGSGARPLFDNVNITTMAERITLHRTDVRVLGEDLRITYRPQESIA